MEDTHRPVLATLAYYGALRRPLSILEIHERLIPSARLGISVPTPSLGALASLADRMVAAGTIETQYGLYALKGTGDFGHAYINRQKNSAQKFQTLLKYAWWLQAVPYIRTLAASGSMAMNSCGPDSDWDMFVIAKAGRLYTARLGLLAVAFLQRRLRTKKMRTAPDRFCFNHLITNDGLAIRHCSLFTAHALAWLVPMYDPWAYMPRLRQANGWVGDFVAQPGGEQFVRRSLKRSRFLDAIRWCGEAMLNTPVGTLFEAVVRRRMQTRIEAEPVTHEAGGRIVADEREIEFHPRSFEAVALARYNASLTRFGMGQYAERDSGLRS
jgi:hypothetical protein